MIKKCVEDLNRHFSKESIRWQEVYETMLNVNNYCCCGSAIKLWLTLCDPIECIMPWFHVLHCLPEFVQSLVHWVGDVCNHLVLCHLLLLLPSIFPSIGVFSNESALHIKYWSFSFSISPSRVEYSGLISFRIDWFDLFAVQGTLKSLLQYHN